MNRVAVMVALGAVALASCETGGSTHETASRAPTSRGSTSLLERDVSGVPTSTPIPATNSDVTPTSGQATVDALLAALADPSELPSGWQAKAEAPETALRPTTGLPFGTCGGDNLDATAMQHGVVAFAASPRIRASQGGFIFQQLFAFPSPTEANAFMAAWRAAPSCRDGTEASVEEGHLADQHDGFTSEREEFTTAVWHTHESVSLSTVTPTDVDDAFGLARQRDYQSTVQSVAYGSTETVLLQYERLHTVVAVTSISGRCCLYGYADSELQVGYTPTDADLQFAVSSFRPRLISALTSAKVLSP